VARRLGLGHACRHGMEDGPWCKYYGDLIERSWNRLLLFHARMNGTMATPLEVGRAGAINHHLTPDGMQGNYYVLDVMFYVVHFSRLARPGPTGKGQFSRT